MDDVIKPINIYNIIGKPRNRIARIGVELEGGWKKLPEGAHLERDASVFNDDPPPGIRAGELALGPMIPAYLTTAIKKYYPQKVDHTCGLHVHMSFETVGHYALLMAPEYQETMIEGLSMWAKSEGFPETHHIWKRLEGTSKYCQKKFWPDQQILPKRKDYDQNRNGHRYTIINYCYEAHGTIECRVLPMMEEASQAIRAVRRVLDITNACLVVLSKRKAKYQGKVELSDYEEYVEKEVSL